MALPLVTYLSIIEPLSILKEQKRKKVMEVTRTPSEGAWLGEGLPEKPQVHANHTLTLSHNHRLYPATHSKGRESGNFGQNEARIQSPRSS